MRAGLDTGAEEGQRVTLRTRQEIGRGAGSGGGADCRQRRSFQKRRRTARCRVKDEDDSLNPRQPQSVVIIEN